MATTKPHTHICWNCKQPFECHGEWKPNYDGFPEVICTDFHERGYDECPSCEDETPDHSDESDEASCK